MLSDHKDTAFVLLKALLEPFGLTQFYTDDWGAYQRLLHPAFHPVGKTKTQTIERKASDLTYQDEAACPQNHLLLQVHLVA